MNTDTRYDDSTLQAAIDAALIHAQPVALACVLSLDWDSQAPARLSLAHALLARLPESNELCTSLKKTVELMCKDWADDHTRLQKMCRDAGCTEAEVEGSPDGVPGILELAELLAKRNHLPEPTPPTADGKTPGQVAFEASEAKYQAERKGKFQTWEEVGESCKAEWEAAASAVLAAFGQASLEAGIKPESTFEAHGQTWTKHTPGDTMPCDGEALVFITSDNPDVLRCASLARDWHWGTKTEANIIGWRYADKPNADPVIVPLDASDIRATDEFRNANGKIIQIAKMWNDENVDLSYSGETDYARLACFLRRQHGSDEWKPCTKEAQP